MAQYSRASTVLSVSSIRQQFSNRSNILLSLRSFKFLSQIDTLLRVEDDEPPDIQLHESGYLFLASEKGEEILRENHALQVSLGAQVKLLRPSELSQKYPWLNLDGIALGSLGEWQRVGVLHGTSVSAVQPRISHDKIYIYMRRLV